MKKRYALIMIFALCLSAFSFVGCSKQDQAANTKPITDSSTKAQEQYTPQSQPLENADVGDVKAREITPSGDSNCFLSPCDCNCYQIANVPLTAKKVTCGVNCRGQYGITGCVYRGDKCVALKTI